MTSAACGASSTTLHGNGRGLADLFAAAVQSLGAVQEELFLQKLAQAEADMQTDMALDVIVAHLSSAEKTLLARLPVYPTPVPPEGIQKLGLDLSAAPQTILQRLLAVSLVERTYAHRWQAYEYQLSPLVGAWLHAQDWPQPPQGLFQQAAVYQLYLFRQERKTLPQALAVYQAQRAAGADEAAYRFALDVIVGPLNRQGLYQTLLDEWLPVPAPGAEPIHPGRGNRPNRQTTPPFGETTRRRWATWSGRCKSGRKSGMRPVCAPRCLIWGLFIGRTGNSSRHW